MKILINGFHWGGNTPPFIQEFIKQGHDAKLICPYALDWKGLNKIHKVSEQLSASNLVFPKYNILEKKLIVADRYICLVLLKFGIYQSLLHKYTISIKIKKIKELIESLKPNIIYNHSFSEESFILIKTGFKPQVSFPFGSDVQGKNAWRKKNMHKVIISESSYIIAALEGGVHFLKSKLDVPEDKISKPIPLGLPKLYDLVNYNVDVNEVLRRYNIPEKSIRLIDVRGLRRIDGGALMLIKLINHLKEYNIHLILTKGFLGNDTVLFQAKEMVNLYSLHSFVSIIENELVYDELIALIKSSEIGFSLLPHDGLGRAIMEYVSQGCQLIVTDLYDYKIAFEENAEYVIPDNESMLLNSIKKVLGLSPIEKEIRAKKNLDWLYENQNFERNCSKLLEVFENSILQKS